MNRGVLICDECCSVHRSLGRHISQVKHLRHSSWSPTLLAVCEQLMLEIESNFSKDYIEKDRFFYNYAALSSRGHDNTMSSLTSVNKNYLFFLSGFVRSYNNLIAFTYRVLTLKSSKSLVVRLIYFNELKVSSGLKRTGTSCVRICFRSISCCGYY